MDQLSSYHLEYLSRELQARCDRNPQYSLRSFARDLQVTPGWLSDFLNSKKGISGKKAEAIAKVLGLTRQELELFVLSALASHARDQKKRREALKKLSELKTAKIFKLATADFVEAGAWYHQAILELTELEDFEHTPQFIAKRLRLPVTTIRRAIQELINVGLLEMRDDKYIPLFQETETTMDKPSVAIKNYHSQILEKADQALQEQNVQEREFISATFAFDSAHLNDAKKALRMMQKQFADEFYGKSENKDSVYQVSLQFFRLDRKDSEQ